MKKQLLFLLLFCVATLNVKAQTTCSAATNSQVLADVLMKDNTEHSSQDHHVIFTPKNTCTYAHGATTYCNTQCAVDEAPIGSVQSETGTLNAAGTHMVSHGFNSGRGSASNGGISCTGTVAAAATNCYTVPLTQICFISVSFSNSNLSVSTNGHQIWQTTNSIPNNCAAVKDPQNTSTGIPGCQTDCPLGSRTCVPCGQSPIILDVDGNGYQLTDALDGVRFDISGTGNPIQMGWTAAGSTNAFLALPGPDGLIHNGQQLFGNFTPQPPSDQPNGFAALTVYDDPGHGGNGDGIIDAHDAVFALLRLWIDANHDGISQPEELHTLPSLGVNSISLNYKWDNKTDEFGNVYRFRAHVNPDGKTDVGKTAYDVFFVAQTGRNVTKNNKCIVPGGMPQLTSSLGLE